MRNRNSRVLNVHHHQIIKLFVSGQYIEKPAKYGLDHESCYVHVMVWTHIHECCGSWCALNGMNLNDSRTWTRRLLVIYVCVSTDPQNAGNQWQ